MRKRPPTTTFLFIIFVCFVVGFLTALLRGVKRDEDVPSNASTDPSGMVTGSPAPGQYEANTFVILGVDSLGSEAPSLRAVWLAVSQGPESEILLYGVPVNAQLGSTSSAPLNELFRWSLQDGVSPLFLSVLSQITPSDPELVIVLDEAGFAEVIDFMGGVVLSGEHLTGGDVLNVLRLLYDDPGTALSIQVRILEAMTSQLKYLPDALELTPLVSLMPEHAHTSRPPEEIFAMLGRLIPLQQLAFRVNVWDGSG